MSKGPAAWLSALKDRLARLYRGVRADDAQDRSLDRGILVFQNTSEVIAAEQSLKKAGIEVEIKGPPPNLQTGCDMVLLFPIVRQAAVEKILNDARLKPEQIVSGSSQLLDPVSLFHTKDLGAWLMVRAANMKITIDKQSCVIVNISGGGCPDVPWLAAQLCGKKLQDAPAPLSMGHTLCCYSLQKAFDELKRISACG